MMCYQRIQLVCRMAAVTYSVMIPLVVLFSWPLVCLAFFKRYSAPFAVFVSILAGYLLLPEKTSLDLPLLPALDKRTVPALAAGLLAMVMIDRSPLGNTVLSGLVPRLLLVRVLLALLVFGAFMTVVTNSDRLFYGPTTLPGLRPYDAFSYILNALMFVLPMLLARKFLGTPDSHRMILKILCMAGLGYSLLVLIEVRMSPLLHYWVYGFFPHSWIQHVRGDGSWRPVVFMGHGLLVGIFLSGTVLAAVGMSKNKNDDRRRVYLVATLWLLVILVLSRNFGALIITLVLVPVALLLTVRLQLIVASLIAVTFLLYPLAREAQIIPIDAVVERAAEIDPDRANSLLVRLKNEDAFLEKTSERVLFGWGGWGRSRTYNEETGVDVTIADGSWVITLSVSGWVGYVARFGLICFPLFLLLLNRRKYNIGPETSLLALIVAGNLVDLIPNSSLTPITALVAGGLWGRIELGVITRTEKAIELDDNLSMSDRDSGPEQRTIQAAPASAYTRQRTRIRHNRAIRKKV